MYAVYGVLLLAASVFLQQFFYVQHRRPQPAAWTKPEIASQLSCLVTMVAFASGLGMIVHFFAKYDLGNLTLANDGEMLASIAVAVALVVSVRRQLQGRSPVGASEGK